jgi:hypothetical protein
VSSRILTFVISVAIAAIGASTVQGFFPPSVAAICDELVINGGFEAGSLGWTQSSAGGYDLISDFNPFAGVRSAYLGGIDNAEDRLSQAMTLPIGATSITLRAWWSIATSETGGAFDWLTLSLLRPDGSLLVELVRIDDNAEPDLWDELVVELISYAGQPVVLQAHAATDDSNPTDFFVDDISILACITSSTPTPTPTATQPVTPTPTATRSVTPTPTALTSPIPTATAETEHRLSYLPLVFATGE